MVLRREAIEQRLKELDEVLPELGKYREADHETLRQNLSQRWIVERGLIAAASIILDVADHILAGHLRLRGNMRGELASLARQSCHLRKTPWPDKRIGWFS